MLSEEGANNDLLAQQGEVVEHARPTQDDFCSSSLPLSFLAHVRVRVVKHLKRPIMRPVVPFDGDQRTHHVCTPWNGQMECVCNM